MADDNLAAKAKHGEIKRRYERKRFVEDKPGHIRSIRRAQVLDLLRDRHGAALPDDEHGRLALQILFELGLDGMAAHHLARWADGDETARLIKAADGNFRDYSKRRDVADPTIDPKLIPERLGERLEISFDEYKRLGLKHLRPCDAPRHVVDEFIRDRKAKRDSNRDRRLAKPTASPRALALYLGPLANRKPWTVRALADFAQQQRLGDFEGLAAPRTAVLRAARELQRLGMVKTKIEDGPRGLKVLSVERPWTQAEIDDAHRLDDVEEAT